MSRQPSFVTLFHFLQVFAHYRLYFFQFFFFFNLLCKSLYCFNFFKSNLFLYRYLDHSVLKVLNCHIIDSCEVCSLCYPIRLHLYQKLFGLNDSCSSIESTNTVCFPSAPNSLPSFSFLSFLIRLNALFGCNSHLVFLTIWLVRQIKLHYLFQI